MKMEAKDILSSAKLAAQQVRKENRWLRLLESWIAWRREKLCRKGKHFPGQHTLIRHVNLFQKEGDTIPCGIRYEYKATCRTCGKVQHYSHRE